MFDMAMLRVGASRPSGIDHAMTLASAARMYFGRSLVTGHSLFRNQYMRSTIVSPRFFAVGLMLSLSIVSQGRERPCMLLPFSMRRMVVIVVVCSSRTMNLTKKPRVILLETDCTVAML